MYFAGNGVPQDDVQSRKWLILAAADSERSDQEAIASHLEALSARMTVPRIAEAERLAREWKPTNNM
jgi:TPR repeat protein